MGTTPSKLPQLKLGKLNLVRQRLLQRYEHEPFVSCLSGLYGCQWKRNQRTRAHHGHCCCSKLECGSFALIVLTFCVTLVFLYFWGEVQNDYNDFNWFNFGNLGFWFPWSMVLLILAVCLFTYVAVLLLLAVCLLSEGQRLYLHWCHKIGISVTLILSIVATSVLTDLWRKEWLTVVLSFQVTAPYLHIGGVALMTLLSWPIAFHVFRINLRVRRMAIVVLYIVVLMALYLVPLGIHSPCIKERNSLGPAPALIGHRGAPMLAPENTYMSFEKAVAAGSDGLETDVTISYDGVPFLMHDKNLRRTTNVKEVFPNWTDVSPAMFTWRELKSLNAGSWFLSQDPFGTASSLSADEHIQAQNQSVCTLMSFLDLAAQHGKLVIFDLYRPPRGHPYRDAWISRTLEVIQNESSIHSSQVLWLPSELREFVHDIDPMLQQTSNDQAAVKDLQLRNIVKLNIHYSSMSEKDIRNYAAANISTNLYVISEPWLFSLAWCVGARSVTTNAVHILKNLQRPLLLMTPDEYRLMWALTDLTSLILILIIFVFHWWRERGLDLCVGKISALENGSFIQFRTEINEVWSLSNTSASEKQGTSLAGTW
ncbi:glycerophosphodiester phosphodiesterase domain-containing protein 5 [Triplophysa rosa]|uniref:Glycerophosphodiester phosphodiesterase domain-containing protein 5 n=1 Tax=Triplophysa rosa TaxID=992332 RepID=A0A9W7WED3_TRIRA|nr:glycerophosphodiester phosphodiesterase domain-containing protein 5 [Triplophysa rosa]KAI7795994.1 putative glycerophosphodiester phosphodiesterase domain-containing protein 5 [Triplophysa rosa]